MKWILKYLDETTSTNDVAETLPVGSCVVAKSQTKGRGKCGRSWVSEEGNLFFSVVLKNFEFKTPLLSFVVALSVAESLKNFGVTLKWPNDVLLNHRKVAGILLENKDEKVIAGIGVNTLKLPRGNFLYKTGCLGGQIHNDVLLEEILSRLDYNLELFETKGFIPVRQKWLSFACGLGEKIKICLPNEEIIGIFLDLTGEGLLKLGMENLPCRYVSAGDVFLLTKGNENE